MSMFAELHEASGFFQEFWEVFAEPPHAAAEIASSLVEWVILYGLLRAWSWNHDRREHNHE